MRTVADKKDLQKAVQDAVRIAGQKSTLPILEHVLLEAKGDHLAITAYDMEAGIVQEIPATTEAEGAVTVHGKSLRDLLKTLKKGELSLQADAKSMVEVVQGDVTATLNGLPAEEFPALPTFDGAQGFNLKGAEFFAALDRTLWAASKDETRAILTGVLLEVQDKRARLVATDSYRLSIAEAGTVRTSQNLSVIIPAESLALLRRLWKKPPKAFRVAIHEQQFSISEGSRRLVTRLIEGQFPNCERVATAIDAQLPTSWQFRAGDALAACKRLETIAKQEAGKVVIVANGNLSLSTEAGDAGKLTQTVPATVTGPVVTTAFNVWYLMNVLACLPEDASCVMGLNCSLSTVSIRSPEVEGFRHYLAPMQL